MWVVFFPDARTPRRAATRLVPRSPQDLPHRLPLVRVRRTTSKTESTTSQKWKLEQVLQGRLNLSFQNKLKSSKISTPRNFGKYTICLLIRVDITSWKIFLCKFWRRDVFHQQQKERKEIIAQKKKTKTSLEQPSWNLNRLWCSTSSWTNFPQWEKDFEENLALFAWCCFHWWC